VVELERKFMHTCSWLGRKNGSSTQNQALILLELDEARANQ
jgi:hypothetical protein